MSAHNRNIAVIRNFIERQNKNSVGEWASIFTDRKRCDKVEIETNWNLEGRRYYAKYSPTDYKRNR